MTTQIDIVRRACAKAGLDATDATPIRLAENEIWRLPSAGVVVRIPQSHLHQSDSRAVAISRWLASNNVSAVQALDDIEQPIDVDGRGVTFWKELPAHSSGTINDVARLLRQMHHLPIPDFELGRVEPFVRVEERIRSATFLSAEDQGWLLDLRRELEHEWTQLPEGLSECVVHGDAWTGNCVVDAAGRAYFLDFERASIGPPEWDLVSTAVRLSIGGLQRDEYLEFCQIYGRDVTEWPGFAALRSIRELRIASWAAQVATSHPEWPK